MDIQQELQIYQNAHDLVHDRINQIGHTMAIEQNVPTILADARRKQVDRYERVTTGLRSIIRELAMNEVLHQTK